MNTLKSPNTKTLAEQIITSKTAKRIGILAALAAPVLGGALPANATPRETAPIAASATSPNTQNATNNAEAPAADTEASTSSTSTTNPTETQPVDSTTQPPESTTTGVTPTTDKIKDPVTINGPTSTTSIKTTKTLTTATLPGPTTSIGLVGGPGQTAVMNFGNSANISAEDQTGTLPTTGSNTSLPVGVGVALVGLGTGAAAFEGNRRRGVPVKPGL